MQAAAGNLKKVSLELGGKSPNIVLRDADLETAIPGAANAIFFNHGQCCCAGSRLFIEAKAYDKIMPTLIDHAEKIKLKYQDIDGVEKVLSADGLLAIAIQHEMDHLEGKLFVDYLSPLKREMVRKKLAKQRKLAADAA